jgi:hypothetical protein
MSGREVAYWHLGDVGASVNGRFAPKAAIPVKSAFDPACVKTLKFKFRVEIPFRFR